MEFWNSLALLTPQKQNTVFYRDCLNGPDNDTSS